MSNGFVQYRPAIRLVNSVGAVTAGPTVLYQPTASSSYGIWLKSARVEYQPELLGPWMSFGYAKRWRKLGYRPHVSLDFALLETDNTSTAYGLDLLLSYYNGGVSSETFGSLQFNLFSTSGSSPWRSFVPESAWAPQPAQGKQFSGHTLTMDLSAVELITDPGWYGQSTW